VFYSQAPPEYLLRKVNNTWVKHLIDIKSKQSNLGVEIPCLLMCKDPTKTKPELEDFLNNIMKTLNTPELIKEYRDRGFIFYSLGGNHTCQVARELFGPTTPQWGKVSAVVICCIEETFKGLIRGVRIATILWIVFQFVIFIIFIGMGLY